VWLSATSLTTSTAEAAAREIVALTTVGGDVTSRSSANQAAAKVTRNAGVHGDAVAAGPDRKRSSLPGSSWVVVCMPPPSTGTLACRFRRADAAQVQPTTSHRASPKPIGGAHLHEPRKISAVTSPVSVGKLSARLGRTA
jgi:hypothetical protein